MSEAITRMENEHDAEVAKLKEKEGGEKGDEKLHVKADERKGGERVIKSYMRKLKRKRKSPIRVPRKIL